MGGRRVCQRAGRLCNTGGRQGHSQGLYGAGAIYGRALRGRLYSDIDAELRLRLACFAVDSQFGFQPLGSRWRLCGSIGNDGRTLWYSTRTVL